MKKILFILLTLTLAACTQQKTSEAESPLVFQQENVSRSLQYLVFKQGNVPYEFEAEVGGEHMNIQMIWAFKDQSFQVSLTPLENTAELSVSGEGLKIQENPSETGKQFTVTILDDSAIIELSQTAYPDPARYRISITRVK